MKTALIILSLAVCLPSAAQDNSCAVLRKAGSTGARKFLEQQSVIRRSTCITSMIKRLGDCHDVKAVHVLVDYLDYLDPATAPRQGGESDLRPDYPAINALFQIGKPATPELIAEIRHGASPLLRRNATLAFLFVYRDDLASGIRLLKKEERTATTTDDRQRLNQSLEKLFEACAARLGKEAQECKKAAG
jgi:hypothetical protein